MDKLWCIKKYYSELRRNELSSHEKTWRELKYMLLSEKSQPERLCTITFQFYDILKKGKTMETVEAFKGSVIVRSQGRGCMGRAQRVFRAAELFCMILQW